MGYSLLHSRALIQEFEMPYRFHNSWRALAATIYDRPRDGRVYGNMEFDVTDTMQYIERRAEEGVKLSITHFVIAATARSLAAEAEAMNVYLIRGKVRRRETVDVMVSVDVKGQAVTAMKIRDADQKTVTQIAEEIRSRTANREALAKQGATHKNPLLLFPIFIRKPLFQFLRWLALDVGVPLKPLGLHTEMLGSVMITNIGVFGLKTGFVALMPAGNVPSIVATGKVTLEPKVVDGEVKIRNVLPMTGTFDHRCFDGSHIGALGRGLERFLSDPTGLDSLPGSQN